MNPGEARRTALPLRDLPDRELVSRCRSGEMQAFNELVARHQDRIYSVIYRSCGNAEDAADVTQGAFLNAFRHLADFKGDSAFSTWIYRIAFNQLVSLRRGRKPRTVSLAAPDEETPAMEPADERRPSDPLESEELKDKVQQALNLLEEGDRNIVLLRDLQGHSYDEIAAVLGIPAGTVRSRLHRARLELKSRLVPFSGTCRP